MGSFNDLITIYILIMITRGFDVFLDQHSSMRVGSTYCREYLHLCFGAFYRQEMKNNIRYSSHPRYSIFGERPNVLTQMSDE